MPERTPSRPSNPETRRSRREAASSTARPKRRWLRRTLWGILAVGVLGVLFVLVSYLLIQPPKPNDIATAQTSIVYFADGKTEMARISDINRESVPIGDIPKHVQQAMLAAEDRKFYEQNGISPTGIARAVWVAIRGGQATQGGSTITQQYVKNYFLTADRTLTRKYKEILISIKLDQQLTKDQILENYFNTIYYGRGAYGIQTAAKAYFGKNAKDLTLEEGAFLAAVIRGPSLYDPALGPDQEANAKQRWGYVLDGMVQEGWLTQQERDAATFPTTITYRRPTLSGPNGYLVQMVKNELEKKLELSPADIDRGGLRIVTTIDRAKQKAAIEAVKETMPADVPDPQLNVGLASVKPGDGAIVALYGGADYAKNQWNSAVDAQLQAGSTFKVFTLIGALQSGEVSLRSTFPGYSPQRFPEFAGGGDSGGSVSNFGNSSFGTLDVPTATAYSVNTIYAQLNIIGTPQRTAKAATDAGVTTKVDTNYANTFGTDAVKVLDMANAYATIAAEGLHATPYIVKSARTPDGSLDYLARPETKQAFDKDLMADVISAMQAVVRYGSGSFASTIGRPAAGKTGTTSDNYAAWFDGFTPQLATAVGIYRGDGSLTEENRMVGIAGLGEITGGSIPVRVWTAYMRTALEGTEVLEFPPAANINEDAAPSVAPPPPPPSPSPSASEASASPTPTPTPTEPTPQPSPTGQPTPQPPGPTAKPTPPGVRPPGTPRPTITPNEP